MFARLDAFEAMLFDNFDDEPRKKLAAILRLWVNLLRTGRLIKVELVCTEELLWILPDTPPDKAPAGRAGRMRMGGRLQNLPARCLGSVHFHHRCPRIAASDLENGHLPHRPRGQRRRSQVCQRTVVGGSHTRARTRRCHHTGRLLGNILQQSH